ncbi:hypothetical protein IQ07DRAFT_671853, partial [Pyrenochaeta sp. DS3sAY3a]
SVFLADTKVDNLVDERDLLREIQEFHGRQCPELDTRDERNVDEPQVANEPRQGCLVVHQVVDELSRKAGADDDAQPLHRAFAEEGLEEEAQRKDYRARARTTDHLGQEDLGDVVHPESSCVADGCRLGEDFGSQGAELLLQDLGIPLVSIMQAPKHRLAHTRRLHQRPQPLAAIRVCQRHPTQRAASIPPTEKLGVTLTADLVAAERHLQGHAGRVVRVAIPGVENPVADHAFFFWRCWRHGQGRPKVVVEDLGKATDAEAHKRALRNCCCSRGGCGICGGGRGRSSTDEAAEEVGHGGGVGVEGVRSACGGFGSMWASLVQRSW